MTFALLALFSVFTAASYAGSSVSATVNTECDGGHKCTDKCKKDENGKCTEAKAECKSDEKKADCCKKDAKSCHGKEAKAGKKSKKSNSDS